jgi:DNA polymerase-1
MKEVEIGCGGCNLNPAIKTRHIKPDGSIDAEVLILGEAPGADEDQEGRPFCGRSGNLLRKALDTAGIESICFDNVVRCRPPHNATPRAKDVTRCLPYAIEHIRTMLKLRLIVLVGNIALKAMLNRTKITEVSGKLLKHIDYPTLMFMPLIHPASVLYDSKNMKLFLESVSMIQKILNGTATTLEKEWGEYKTIVSIDEWREFVRTIKDYLVIDTETQGLNPFAEYAQLKCISLSSQSRTGVCLPFDGRWEEKELNTIVNDLWHILCSPSIKKIGQDIKYDMLWLREILGIKVEGLYRDTMITQYVIDPNSRKGLKEQAWQYTGLGGYEDKILKVHVADAEGDDLYLYASLDADVTGRVADAQEPILLSNSKLVAVVNNLMIPVTNVLCDMEYRGVKMSPHRLVESNKKLEELIEAISYRIHQHPSIQRFEEEEHHEINLNSGDQLRKVLFTIEGLEATQFTDKEKKPSTDKEHLLELAVHNELCKWLVGYTKYTKLQEFTIKLAKMITPDCRIHTRYHITTTKTTRTSSSDPNLQNIPVGANDLAGLRKAFIPDPEFILVEFDFNQHELRVMADEAKDYVLMQDLRGDVHAATTAAVLEIPIEQVTKEQRRNIGKVINFGLIYGMSEFGLAYALGVSVKTAQKYLMGYFNRYRAIRTWRDQTAYFVKRNGYVDIRSGFRRPFPILSSMDEKTIQKTLRTALNVPIQGLAGNILEYALIGVDKLLEDYKSKLLMEVHDSLVCQIHESERDIIPEIKDVMINYFKPFIPSFEVPLDVDYKIGPSWGEMKELEK